MGLEIRPAVTNGNIRKWRNRMIEEWRDIPNFEGLYLISNLGHVKSVERYKRNNSGTQFVNERLRVLSPDKDGYLRVCLSKDGLHYVKSVHRLVAEAFIPNPDNLPVINHKNEDKQDNRVENLEWCTVQYNTCQEASRQTGIPQANIYKVCKGERKHAGGYEWRFKDEY